MGEIKITPEELKNRAKTFSYAQGEAKDRHNKILNELFNLQTRWIGASSLSFFNELPTLNKACESYITHLKKIEEELIRIATKFETVDNQGVNLGIAKNMSAGNGASDNGILQKITDVLSTKESSKYMYEEESGPFSAKALGGELKAGTIAGASATYNTVKVGFEVSKDLGDGKKIKSESNLSMANVELSAKLDKTNIEFGAEASLAKYETGIDFPIPFTDHDLHIGGAATLGQVGGSVKAGSSGFKISLPWGPGASLVGTALEVEVK
ncbi:WXG100 family type VII secretion target [Bacillus cereus]|uniref:Group-specific protein n=1 Tax=Bacillus cereus (strain ZK / E33L) TaxID=288681 RepID=Q638D5_BACCZ|nr:WXG100 family type VII secretion target [Bacillus cereus]AAU17121.1 group-specific protein [Bacillus cereus E33L]AJI28198.1 type VII secretion target family protein [Bacillus cereus E33L]MCU5555871.1 WXG100 family type VII secretion target [Bacillus cereus]QQA22940.1 WXG100 family type VII secretion target [Bacillus cereus]HDR4900606.1 WXG100 family type VII secretion target [Bacillus cereus]